MNPFSNVKNYNCIVTYNGEQYKINGDTIANANLDYFNGWVCAAGTERISITSDDHVYSGNCLNDYLGTVHDWKLLTSDVICKKSRCGSCTDDLIVRKHKI